MIPLLDTSWEKILSPEFEKPYFQKIQSFLLNERKSGKIIYPHAQDIFTSLNSTTFEKVKVLILGQDPYHGVSQAHGLSFSVQNGMRVPPSLKNIYKEIKNEFPEYIISESGNLEHWAQQGVLLLNSILTVEAGKPASHSKIGWEIFTDSIISYLSEKREGVIFLLWGNFARSKKVLIDTNKHFILESPHPSPFSAHTGFLGNGHFKKVNEILLKRGEKGIKW